MPAYSQDTRTLTARRVLDVERGAIIAVEGNPLDDLNAFQKGTFVMKAGQQIDRSTL